MKQRGFIQLSMMGWAAIAAGVVILGLGMALTVQSARLDTCQADKVKLEAQAKILGAQIAEQNRAVSALAAAGAAKTAAGVKALAAADKKAKVWEDNALRLQTILTNRKPTDPQDCKTALQEIRK